MTQSISSLREAVVETSYITGSAIDLLHLLAAANDPRAGAIVLFSGDVRNHSNGRDVAYLEYEAQAAIAARMMKDIIDEAKATWNLTIAMAQHRIGMVPVCESAVIVVTASAHRHEAFTANRYIIDRIKHEAPIWKCEFFTDGTKEWGGNCNCHTITGEIGKHIY